MRLGCLVMDNTIGAVGLSNEAEVPEPRMHQLITVYFGG